MRKVSASLIAVAGASGLLCGSAVSSAALVHRYSFNTAASANDSLGTANGTINGTATVANGVLTTTGAAGQTNNVALPTTVGAGITGDFSIEDFVTIPTNPGNFSSLFSLSSAQSPGSATTGFLLLNPSRPAANNDMTVDFDQGAAGEVDIASAAPFPFGTTEHDVAVTYVAATNIATLYLDGAVVGTGSVAGALATGLASFNLSAVSNGAFDGIAGNPPYNDPGIAGTTDDFRIYNSALTAGQVGADFTAGPNATIAVPEPATLGLVAVVGGAALARRRGRTA